MTKYYISDLSKVGLPAASTDDSNHNTFDVIVVGGGTAGCALAARLSEDPSISVLLLEAGGSGTSLLFSRIPSAYSKLFKNPKHVFQFYTEPQTDAQNEKKFWPRALFRPKAKMLGGCSAINAQMAQYGAPGDFDEWAKIIGDDAWNWANFSGSFKKFEKYTASTSYPDVDISVKGSSGPVEVGYNSYYSESSKDFVESCVKKGIPMNHDFNTTKGPNGVNRISMWSSCLALSGTDSNSVRPFTVTYINKDVSRVSTESAYLTPDVLARSNLKVVINASVTKVLFHKSGDGETKAVGVEFAKDRNGKVWRAKANEEVVLCGGAIHSPQVSYPIKLTVNRSPFNTLQLLLLSGVGASAHLKEHKIPVVHDLPGVGQNLVDHPVVDFWFKDKSKLAPSFMVPSGPMDLVKTIKWVALYLLKNGAGILGTNWGEAASFVRSDDPQLFPRDEYPIQVAKDSTSGPTSPDLEIFITTLAYKKHGAWTWGFPTFSIHACLLRPLSRGAVTLKSDSPWEHPAMDPKYLTDRDDVARLVKGGRFCLNLARTEPISSRIDHTDAEGLDGNTYLKSDEELEKIVRDRVQTLYHPTSTCRMAPLAEGGVVDSHLRVYGIKGLRVCDASIFPEIVSGHTAGASIAVGEKGADILKADLRPNK
ncbi:hypothetical protein V5O48_005466 [Marasmius crinis-equi]|uniref:Alcohol oxidase n=1 Tax=Marasmius crinis-equi TaxID=585013 RepID=A0ABR3FMH2_9AGAR